MSVSNTSLIGMLGGLLQWVCEVPLVVFEGDRVRARAAAAAVVAGDASRACHLPPSRPPIEIVPGPAPPAARAARAGDPGALALRRRPSARADGVAVAAGRARRTRRSRASSGGATGWVRTRTWTWCSGSRRRTTWCRRRRRTRTTPSSTAPCARGPTCCNTHTHGGGLARPAGGAHRPCDGGAAHAQPLPVGRPPKQLAAAGVGRACARRRGGRPVIT